MENGFAGSYEWELIRIKPLVSLAQFYACLPIYSAVCAPLQMFVATFHHRSELSRRKIINIIISDLLFATVRSINHAEPRQFVTTT